MKPTKGIRKSNTFMQNITLSNSKDTEIFKLCDIIDKKLNKGIPFKEISLPLLKAEVFDLILYIFSKEYRNKNDYLFLKHYLSSIPSLVNTIHQYKINNDYELLMHKISIFLRCERFEAKTIVCVNGEIGDKYYIIFQGSVGILVPKQYRIQLTQESYYAHLKNLLLLKEFDIFNRTIECNRHVFLSRELFDMTQAMDDKEHLTEIENVSVDDYVNRIQPIDNNSDDSKPKTHFTLWTYHQICLLLEGSSFGDVALSGENKRRTATIITVDNCYIGTIAKSLYESSMKEAQDKIRKQNVERIRNHEIFRGFSAETFDRVFFNYFKLIEFNRGEIIFTQSQKRTEIYFIKEGDVQITSKGTFTSLNGILEKLGEEPITKIRQKQLREMKMSSEIFNKYYSASKVFPLFIVKPCDAIGTDEYAYDNTFFCSAQCISQKCEVFALEIYFFTMFLKQKRIATNYANIMNSKKKIMIKRIIDIKEISINKHYNTVRPILDIEDTPKLFRMPKINETFIKVPMPLLTSSSHVTQSQLDKHMMSEVTPNKIKRIIRISLDKTKTRTRTKTHGRNNTEESPFRTKRDFGSVYSNFGFLTSTLFPKAQTLKKLLQDSHSLSKRQNERSLSQGKRNRLCEIDCLSYDKLIEMKENKKERNDSNLRKPKLKIIKMRRKHIVNK